MPVTYTIDAQARLARLRLFGNVTITEFRATVAEILKSPEFGTDLRVLSDCTGLTTNVTSRDLLAHGNWRSRLPKFRQMALVAPSDFEYGMARMFEIATGGAGSDNLKVFRNHADAYAWPGLPEPKPSSP